MTIASFAQTQFTTAKKIATRTAQDLGQKGGQLAGTAEKFVSGRIANMSPRTKTAALVGAGFAIGAGVSHLVGKVFDRQA